MNQQDLAKVDHWDAVYESQRGIRSHWEPRSYDARSLAGALLRSISGFSLESVLEVGCGNSRWLPWIARQINASRVAGIDYSERGCELSRHQLEAHGVNGTIYCRDLFSSQMDVDLENFDLVFSLGLVEHFTDLEDVLSRLLRFVRPGGVLFTEVPNLYSIHGIMAYAWQPEILAKHCIVKRRTLVDAYRKLGLGDISSEYAGIFSLDIVAWEWSARWPRFARWVAPQVRRVNGLMGRCFAATRVFRGPWITAPFLCVSGRKPDGVEGPALELEGR